MQKIKNIALMATALIFMVMFFVIAQLFYSFNLIADANSYVILPEGNAEQLLNQCSRATPSYQETFLPTNAEIELLEKNLHKLMTLESSSCCNTGKIEGSISKYQRQYVGVYINSKKYIYINAGRKDPLLPINKPIFVCDGGKDFWGALFSPEEIKFSNLAFNGEA